MDFRPMRRIAQLLSSEECRSILRENTSGVLALIGDGGYPYAVPLSYVYLNDAIYFHSARSGHKLDAINSNDKASFCIVDRDDVAPEEYTTRFRSVIIFGRARILSDADEIRAAIDALALKYNPDGSAEGRAAAIEREFAAMSMIRLDIEHISGKQAIELV